MHSARSYILEELSKTIDNLKVNNFMKGYVTALIFNTVYSDFLLSDSDFGCEVDIPDFMKKDNVVKFERRKNEV